MIGFVKSAALTGINAVEVSVEVDTAQGLPTEIIVGLPDAVVKESKSRIKSAIKNSGFHYPMKVYTINLGPAEIKKEGPFFDLPIAAAILIATHQIQEFPQPTLLVGELSLNGEIKPVKGIISIAHLAYQKKIKNLIIPYDNFCEASIIKDLNIIPIKNLKELARIDLNRKYSGPTNSDSQVEKEILFDFLDVKGQLQAKRALEIAASGNHNLLFIGSPGSGKTMLLKRLPSILPKMTMEEALETNKIFSISGKKIATSFTFARPFRDPHHTISYAGMVGGGQNPLPGEISLAHNGVLFLDELPEYPRNVLEILRQPMEEHKVTVSRANMVVEYPANFLLAAAMNPCPCGYYQDEKIKCCCQPSQIQKYLKKISGPILDRIDLIVSVPRLTKEELFEPTLIEQNQYTSSKIKNRVENARQIQEKRQKKPNALMSHKEVENFCAIDDKIRLFLGKAIEKGYLSGRTFNKILKLSRTIADLEKSEIINLQHVSEAMQYRRVNI
ncbi:MAG: YifB family Mg chelatase-like AAA ATPase [Candidatus Margulisiibacteriota bacterium]|jgi:magnesium chelatase family protein